MSCPACSSTNTTNTPKPVSWCIIAAWDEELFWVPHVFSREQAHMPGSSCDNKLQALCILLLQAFDDSILAYSAGAAQDYHKGRSSWHLLATLPDQLNFEQCLLSLWQANP